MQHMQQYDHIHRQENQVLLHFMLQFFVCLFLKQYINYTLLVNTEATNSKMEPSAEQLFVWRKVHLILIAFYLKLLLCFYGSDWF